MASLTSPKRFGQVAGWFGAKKLESRKIRKSKPCNHGQSARVLSLFESKLNFWDFREFWMDVLFCPESDFLLLPQVLGGLL